MDKNCTIYKTCDFLGKKWTILILLELYKGDGSCRRYSELKKTLPGITAKILSLRLKELKKEGLIHKKIDASEYPVKSEYSLSDSGKDFIGIIKNIKSWALKWKIKHDLCKGSDCKNCPAVNI